MAIQNDLGVDGPDILEELRGSSHDRLGKTPKQNKPLHYNQLSGLQQFLAAILIFFARMSDPNGPDAAGTNNILASLLGFGDDVDSYKNWHHQQEETNWKDWKGTTDFSRTNFKEAGNFIKNSANLKEIDFGERQERVMSVLDDAADMAGVSSDMMIGLWGVESGFGQNRLSPSGCLGDFQFTKGTWKEVMNKHGDQIEERLRATGKEDIADQLSSAREQGGSSLLALRDHPEISAYASANYVKDVSHSLHLDATQQQNWGALYAGYNIGSGNVSKLMRNMDTHDVGRVIGDAASWNPKFFRNHATGEVALNNYQYEIERHLARFENSVAKKEASVASIKTDAPRNNPDVVASTDIRGTSVAKSLQLASDPQESELISVKDTFASVSAQQPVAAGTGAEVTVAQKLDENLKQAIEAPPTLA